MDAQTAKDKGFIDEIIGAEAAGGVLYNAGLVNILSPAVINKIRNTVKNPAPSEPFFLMQKKLDLLKLKGEMRNEI